jgi:hypothetical protein
MHPASTGKTVDGAHGCSFSPRGIVLGIVILFLAIRLRKGLMDFAVEWYS